MDAGHFWRFRREDIFFKTVANRFNIFRLLDYNSDICFEKD